MDTYVTIGNFNELKIKEKLNFIYFFKVLNRAFVAQYVVKIKKNPNCILI